MAPNTKRRLIPAQGRESQKFAKVSKIQSLDEQALKWLRKQNDYFVFGQNLPETAKRAFFENQNKHVESQCFLQLSAGCPARRKLLENELKIEITSAIRQKCSLGNLITASIWIHDESISVVGQRLECPSKVITLGVASLGNQRHHSRSCRVQNVPMLLYYLIRNKKKLSVSNSYHQKKIGT